MRMWQGEVEFGLDATKNILIRQHLKTIPPCSSSIGVVSGSHMSFAYMNDTP